MSIKRTYHIFKCRAHVKIYHIIERVLHALSKCGLIKEHKNSYSNVIDQGKPCSAPDIKSERYDFAISYLIRKIEFVSQHWFQTKRGKKIFVVYDNHHAEYRISYRADLQSFFAHFSPKHRMWVHKHSPRVVIPVSVPVTFLEQETGFRYHTCDFSQCRFALEFSLAPDMIDKTAEEVISKSYKVLGDSLTSKITEINKILTGVDCDGEIVSPKNMPLCENILCWHCGLPVFASAENKYKFECLIHGELDHVRVKRVDPVMYKRVLENATEVLESLIQKSCPQDDNL